MDDYIDSFLSSSLWADEDVKESIWSYEEADQSNMALPSSFALYENDRGSFPLSMFTSKLPAQDFSSIAPGIETNVAFENFGEAQLDSKGGICADEISPMMNGSGLKAETMSLPYDTALHAFEPLNIRYPKQISGLEELSFTEGGNVGGFCEQFSYNRSFTDSQNLSSMQQTWPSSSYRGVTPVLTAMGQETTGPFGIREGNLDDESNSVLKRNVSMGHIVLEKSASIALEEKEEFRSYPASSLTDVPSRRTTNGVSFQSQTSSAGSTVVCNGTGKARVRARRGQATDPHSIAERLRREKIAERMKNLQELVPKSTKADKASMLDDIIEYVKFLQLQVKVLSMSRLGAAEAVIPLITHGQTEACNNLLLSTSTEPGNHISASPEQIAFEEEVLKLMESNMTMAIQHLQSKGLCLMPIALANAISSEKASLGYTGFKDQNKIGFAEDNIAHTKSNSNSSSSSCSFSGDVPRYHDGNDAAQKLGSEDVNGNVKIEKGQNDFSGEIKYKPPVI